jgi:glycosyltransferase involved in cell wall biosynthesis
MSAEPVVLMLHDYPPITGGGLAIAVQDLVRFFDGRFRFLVHSSRLVDDFADDRQRSSPRGRFARLREIWASLQQADCVVVHWTFSFRWLSSLALLVAPLLGKPTVCVIHTAPSHCSYNRLRHLPPRFVLLLLMVIRYVMRRCTAVIALSRAHRKALLDVGIPVTHLLPMPVFTPSSYDHCYRLHVEANAPPRTLGIASELSVLKGADEIPRLLRSLTPEFAFRIIGRGSFASQLQNCVRALEPAQQACILLSDRLEPEQMPDFYQSVDCLLVCSRTEAHSRVVIEAMLAGVIVLARPTDGTVDLVVDGYTGFHIDPADPTTVRNCLLRLAEDPKYAQVLRTEARQLAERLIVDAQQRWDHLLDGVTRQGLKRLEL